MAYSSTVTVSPTKISGRRAWVIEVAETEAAAASEWSTALTDDLPHVFTITHFQATLTAGTGTTITPRLGAATGFTDSTQDHIATQGTAGAHIHDASAVPVTIDLNQTPRIFGNSQVDAGTDNSVTTKLVIVEGHDL